MLDLHEQVQGNPFEALRPCIVVCNLHIINDRRSGAEAKVPYLQGRRQGCGMAEPSTTRWLRRKSSGAFTTAAAVSVQKTRGI